MSELQNVNREYKDSAFKFIFGREDRKDITLSLFNAVSKTHYTDSSELEITTSSNTLFISMKNDVAFVCFDTLNVYEQQSTWNPNMTIRCIAYFVQQLEKYITKENLNVYSRKLIHFPRPSLVCFYNGKEERPETEILKLSSSYEGKGDVEATVTVYNINKNQEILRECKPLFEYSYFIKKVNEYKEKYGNLEIAINKALDEVPKDFIIYDILLEERNEIMSILKTEYNEDEFAEVTYKDGLEDGIKQGKAEGKAEGIEEGTMKEKIDTVQRLYEMNLSLEQIAQGSKLSINKVKEILDLSNNK